MISDCNHVGAKLVQYVANDPLGFAGQIEPSLIGNDHMIPGLRQRQDKISPGQPEFSKPMKEDHCRAMLRASLDQMEVNTP